MALSVPPARQGTAFCRLRTAAETVTLVITLMAYGCPLQALVAAFGLDERTVADWHARAGTHCEALHGHLVAQRRDLGQVQADELWVKLQGLKAWMSTALQVATRLWLSGVIAPQRDRHLIGALVQQIRARALSRPLLLGVDGLAIYVKVIRRAFRDPLPRQGWTGCCRLQPWRGVYFAQ